MAWWQCVALTDFLVPVMHECFAWARWNHSGEGAELLWNEHIGALPKRATWKGSGTLRESLCRENPENQVMRGSFYGQMEETLHSRCLKDVNIRNFLCTHFIQLFCVFLVESFLFDTFAKIISCSQSSLSGPSFSERLISPWMSCTVKSLHSSNPH